MDDDGVEARHFCHRTQSCSLKAVCTHPRSTHRCRGVHRLRTVDRRGTVLIPLFAHSFHPCTLLLMHTLTVAMRRKLSVVRRRPIDRVQVLLHLAVRLPRLLASFGRFTPPSDMFCTPVFSHFVGLALVYGLWWEVSVVDRLGVGGIVSFSSPSLPRAHCSLFWDACSEIMRVTLLLKSNSL